MYSLHDGIQYTIMKLLDDTTHHRGRGIYLLPNLFTTAALFAGFYAVVASASGHFSDAAIAIFIAMLMDALDGRVARVTHTQTAFGAEYDSLSDMVSFGVAPALVAYHWGLSQLGSIGWLASFVYAATAALRLARFNTQVSVADKRYFQGLPSPSAAAIVASMVWLGHESGVTGHRISIVVAVITVLVALLMVSNFRYQSFKAVNWRDKVPFVAILVIVLVFVFIASNPPFVLGLLFTSYAISGPIETIWQRRRKRLTRFKNRSI